MIRVFIFLFNLMMTCQCSIGRLRPQRPKSRYSSITVIIFLSHYANIPESDCELLVNWVVEYFAPKKSQDSTPLNLFDTLNNSPIIVTDKMPLILQHNGHSRTIVGFEVDKNGVTNLLLFDPAQ